MIKEGEIHPYTVSVSDETCGLERGPSSDSSEVSGLIYLTR